MAKTLNEAAGKFYMGKNLITPTNPFLDEIEEMKRQKEADELNRKLIEADKIKQEEINKKLETLELIPMSNKVVIMPYPQNPYRKIMEGNIIVDYQGDFKNPDSGEWDKMKELVACGKIIEVGPECKFLKPGDDVYYDSRTVYPLPFMHMGHQITSEPQILCVINEKLKERFNMK